MPFMGISDVNLFIVAFIILLLLPGPGNLALVTATSKHGIKAGLITTLGIMLGDQVLLWLATGGVAALLITYPAAFKVMQLVGAAYLAYMGAMLVWKKTEGRAVLELKHGGFIMQGFLLTLLNPKAIMFYMAFFPQFIDAENHLGFMTLLVMAVLVAGMVLVYSVVFCSLTRVLAKPLQRHPKISRYFEQLAGVSLFFFAINMLL